MLNEGEIKLISNETLTKQILEKLKKLKIDIDSLEEPYWKNKRYCDFRTTYIDKENFQFLSYDYYIENVIIRKSKLGKIKTGIFDMGTGKKPVARDISEKKLINEIIDDFEVSTSNQSIHNKFYDNNKKKGGIIPQIEDLWRLRIEDFKDEYSKLKLMKLLYLLSKTDLYGEKINFYLMFQKPTFENIDKTVIGEENRNGRSLAVLKNELIKEIPLDKVREINILLIQEMNKWEELLKISGKYVYYHETDDLLRLAEFLEKKIVELLPTNFNDIIQTCNGKLFDTIYFKVLQHEYISAKTDFIKINAETLKHVSEKRSAKKGLESEVIKRRLVKSYVKANKEKLAPFLIEQNFSEEEARNFVGDNARNIEILVDWFEASYNINFNNRIDPILIVSMLMAIKDVSDQQDSMKYSYYRALQTGNMKLVNKLSRSKKSEEIFHRLWSKKVHFIYSCLCGVGKEAEYNIRIEKALDYISRFMMNYHNFDDFKLCNNHMHNIIKRAFVLDEVAIKNMQLLGNILYANGGYRVEIKHPNVLKLYKMFRPEAISLPLAESFYNDIKLFEGGELIGEYHKKVEITNESNGDKYRGIFKVKVDLKRKVLMLLDYHGVISDEKCEKLSELGFDKMLWKSEEDYYQNTNGERK